MRKALVDPARRACSPRPSSTRCVTAPQNRADEPVAGSRSVVTFDVDTYDNATSRSPSRRGRSGTPATRRSPTASCRCASATAATASPPSRPALGPHERKRLTGCLQDATIDRVRGDVVGIVDLPAA